MPGVCHGAVCCVAFPSSPQSPRCGLCHTRSVETPESWHACRGDGVRQSSATQGSYAGTVLQRRSGGTWGTVVMHDGDGATTPTHDFQDTVVQHPTLRKPAAPRAFGRGSPLPSTTPVLSLLHSRPLLLYITRQISNLEGGTAGPHSGPRAPTPEIGMIRCSVMDRGTCPLYHDPHA